jgi:hypothetical protein
MRDHVCAFRGTVMVILTADEAPASSTQPSPESGREPEPIAVSIQAKFCAARYFSDL